ncbi:hypothetical protein D8B26_008124 [Coccidioides posadasii str. Silveira]|uniref:Uncharacterized protein n=2 Tax=Coccidioides posadasii TaxID=199306 RepID=E9DDV7_COCPS|nr:hypothetical protein CPC735_070760 [Coccidioides posadasii C735 delta SOWgp]EER29394.1 hypothetical protein CPC735_070760 [Coccidioides posadasii C735 delta SOWgp]EFW15311.1 conserved hypothetical protein [Coccidioides posadasii str. Silveira]QVM13516.1 hypothetical protein D8B26_008124 [Coccidioides posadasii str. Silveira]|eukprot:XP_003071539.1 hypothetical protein CPC735_070760 [Coccidioides posadasii C735 delta SOWgp]
MPFGDFQKSSKDIQLLSEHILAAECEVPGSGYNHSEMDLDNCLGDDNGNFQWGGRNFHSHAHNIIFHPDEGVAHVPVLRADLDGGSKQSNVNLGERIGNVNGHLVFRW